MSMYVYCLRLQGQTLGANVACVAGAKRHLANVLDIFAPVGSIGRKLSEELALLFEGPCHNDDAFSHVLKQHHCGMIHLPLSGCATAKLRN